MLALLAETEQTAYRRYIRGGRDDEARTAKRVYMRHRREQARQRRIAFQRANPGLRYIVQDITHGIGGYTNEGCRCRTCNLAWKGIK